MRLYEFLIHVHRCIEDGWSAAEEFQFGGLRWRVNCTPVFHQYEGFGVRVLLDETGSQLQAVKNQDGTICMYSLSERGSKYMKSVLVSVNNDELSHGRCGVIVKPLDNAVSFRYGQKGDEFFRKLNMSVQRSWLRTKHKEVK